MANGTVWPYLVVVPYVTFDKANRILHSDWCPRADTLRLNRTMPPLDLAIALGIVR